MVNLRPLQPSKIFDPHQRWSSIVDLCSPQESSARTTAGRGSSTFAAFKNLQPATTVAREPSTFTPARPPLLTPDPLDFGGYAELPFRL